MTRTHRGPIRSSACAVLFLLLGLVPPAAAHEAASARLAALDRRIAEAPDSALLYLERGEEHRRRGEWDEARADYDQAAELSRTLAEVDLCRGALMLDQGLVEQAGASFDRYLERAPGDPRALWLSGRARARAGRPLVGAVEMEHALARMSRPQPEHYLEWARTLAAAGADHRGQARDALDRGIERIGACVALVDQAVALEVEDGRWQEALARIDRHRAVFGHRVAALVRRGEVLSLAGRDLEARAIFSEALGILEDMPPGQRNSPAVLELRQRMLDNLPAGPPAAARH